MLISAPFLQYCEEKERFVNTKITSVDVLCDDLTKIIIKNGEIKPFFDEYLSHDHLVICDVECLAGKEKTQETVEELTRLREKAGKVTTFLVSVTVAQVCECLRDDFFDAITCDGIVDRYK